MGKKKKKCLNENRKGSGSECQSSERIDRLPAAAAAGREKRESGSILCTTISPATAAKSWRLRES
jgi:hypothetical protein